MADEGDLKASGTDEATTITTIAENVARFKPTTKTNTPCVHGLEEDLQSLFHDLCPCNNSFNKCRNLSHKLSINGELNNGDAIDLCKNFDNMVVGFQTIAEKAEGMKKKYYHHMCGENRKVAMVKFSRLEGKWSFGDIPTNKKSLYDNSEGTHKMKQIEVKAVLGELAICFTDLYPANETVGAVLTQFLKRIGCENINLSNSIIVSGDTLFADVAVELKKKDCFASVFLIVNKQSGQVEMKRNVTIVITGLFEGTLPPFNAACFSDSRDKLSRRDVWRNFLKDHSMKARGSLALNVYECEPNTQSIHSLLWNESNIFHRGNNNPPPYRAVSNFERNWRRRTGEDFTDFGYMRQYKATMPQIVLPHPNAFDCGESSAGVMAEDNQLNSTK